MFAETWLRRFVCGGPEGFGAVFDTGVGFGIIRRAGAGCNRAGLCCMRVPYLRRKGVLFVFEGTNRVVSFGYGLAAVLGCLVAGCAEPEQPVDMYLDGVMLRELGKNELAVEKLKTVIEMDPDFVQAYSELGKAYQVLDRHEEAEAALRTATKLDRWSFEDHLNLARSYRELGRFPAAARAYARAVELDPESREALVGAAQCYLEAGDPVRALTYGEAAEQAGETPETVLPLLARIYEAQKDYEQAIRTYRRWLTLEADNADALLALGLAYMKAERYDSARDVLLSVTQLQARDGRAFRHAGYCLIKLERIEQAIEMYQRAIDLDAEDWEAHRGLGVAYMVRSRRAGDSRLETLALQHWRQSLTLHPDQPRRETLEKLIREHSQATNPLQGLDY